MAESITQGARRRGARSSPGAITTSDGISRDQWQNFLDFYRPLENEMLKSAMQTDFSKEGDEAGRTAGASVSASKGTLSRNLRRVGATLTGEERTGIQRRQSSALTRSIGAAENITRRGLKESRTNMLRQIVGIGRGVAATASAGLQSVADMAAQRQSQWLNQRSATSASNAAGMASLASLAIAFV